MNLPSPALGAIEIALHRYIAADARALARCEALAGHSLAIRLSDLGFGLCFVAERHGLQVRTLQADADVSLTGRSSAFGRVLFSGAREGLTGGGLRIEGDVGIAQRFADLFAGVDFDIADIVDARFGPVPAYVVGRGLAGARRLFARAARELPEQTAEYLREETRDVIGDWEHEQFMRRVETLRDDTERFEARLRRIERGRAH
ncbi:SCP2 sterol-binding domain-containing protein [Salinisphaera sp. T31B1]|uniref:ubiquinone biosynthesis accessory factor UbiJ n=1 Tax=Salinisphaera sp. T31B1 TaxID=727963 RepID=UPI003341C09E